MRDELSKYYNQQKAIGLKELLTVSQNICENSLTNLPHAYFKNKKNFGTTIISLFTHKTAYESQRVSFNIEELIPLLLVDNANRALRKVSRIGDIIPHIQEYPFNLKSCVRL